jgi:hypothetical protein
LINHDAVRRLTFSLTDEIDQGLKELKARDGVPEAESIRRALVAYLQGKGVKLKAPKKR